jgi:hypothetical protein
LPLFSPVSGHFQLTILVIIFNWIGLNILPISCSYIKSICLLDTLTL